MERRSRSTNLSQLDVGAATAKSSTVKSELARQIAKIIRGRSYSQRHASGLTGLTEPKISRLLRGNFRGISEIRMLRCLADLGQDVRIVVASPRDGSHGSITVEKDRK
jgi:predicted XRE-type DNA-binding protein